MSISNDWFDQLYRKNYPFMLAVARNAMGNMNLAEDAVQDSFIMLLLNQDTVRTYDRPDIWLHKVLLGRIANIVRRENKRQHIPLEELTETGAEDTYDIPLVDLLPQGLKDEEREILILYFEKQLSYEEISERLRCSVTTCRTKLFRAKNRCRDLLKEK